MGDQHDLCRRVADQDLDGFGDCRSQIVGGLRQRAMQDGVDFVAVDGEELEVVGGVVADEVGQEGDDVGR
ncbi:hypothetical protein GCM10020001_113220 [Nonomuraea salmonea]